MSRRPVWSQCDRAPQELPLLLSTSELSARLRGFYSCRPALRAGQSQCQCAFRVTQFTQEPAACSAQARVIRARGRNRCRKRGCCREVTKCALPRLRSLERIEEGADQFRYLTRLSLAREIEPRRPLLHPDQ